MISWARKLAISPRLWVSAGLLCFGASIVVGYHQDQLAAYEAMKTKIGTPPETLIQDFNPGQHSNQLNEVRLLAEAGLAQAATYNLGTDEITRWVNFIPIYPVSRQSLPLAETYIAESNGVPRRPFARSDAGKIQAQEDMLRVLDKQPLGIMLSENFQFSADAASASGVRIVGDGQQGPLVSIYGAQISGEALFASAATALEAQDVNVLPTLPLISPYPRGARTMPTFVDYTPLRTALDWAAVVFVLIGVASMFSIFPRFQKPKKEAPIVVEAFGEMPAVFQPIRTQEDLQREEAEQEPTTRRVISRVVSRNYSDA